MAVKYCKFCDQEKDLGEGFYRETDNRCKLCTNEYQRHRRTVQRQQRGSATASENLAMKVLDKILEDKYQKLLDEISNRLDNNYQKLLDEIDNKLDELVVSDKNEKEKKSLPKK
jgi:GTP cyclohydrolase I